MKLSLRGRLFALISFLSLSIAFAPRAQDDWTWKDGTGRTRTRGELEEILANQPPWSGSQGQTGYRAELSGADLSDVVLRGADLDGAALDGANLIRADLSGASLVEADLNKAVLIGVNLHDATLTGANLSGAYLQRANLAGADLASADLRNTMLMEAYLGGADLEVADLSGAVLAGANLAGANLQGAQLADAVLESANLVSVIFEPITTPQIRGIAAATNLQFLTYHDNPDALVQLRNQFKNGGFRDQERKITYAIKRRQAELLWEECDSASLLDCGAYAFNRIFFDITSHYGMNPSRPLLLALAGWFLCTLIYSLFIHFPGASGVYVVKRRAYAGREHSRRLQIRRRAIPPAQRWRRTWQYPLHLFLREWRFARAAMFFSLMSTFNIGFRDFNFGRWLRIAPRIPAAESQWAKTSPLYGKLPAIRLRARDRTR